MFFSGTVARLLVQPGDAVKKGQALAAVVSPDYAAAVSTYRKALVTAQNARKVADLDKDLLEHQGVSAKEEEQAQNDAASAEAAKLMAEAGSGDVARYRHHPIGDRDREGLRVA